MAPPTSTWACSQTRSEKSCAKGTNSTIISGGREGIGNLLRQSLPCNSYSIVKDAPSPCYVKMAKVEYEPGEPLAELPLHEKTIATIRKRLSGRPLYKHQTDALKLVLA